MFGLNRCLALGLGFTLIFLCLVPTKAWALQQFLNSWSGAYVSSDSDDAQCQLCHVNPTGGQPWNAYGWNIRAQYRSNGFDIEQAFTSAETANSDDDPCTPDANAMPPVVCNNLAEINAGTQPGWTQGASNTHYFVNANQNTSNNLPPLDLPAGVFIDPGSTATPSPINNPIQSGIPRGNITIKLDTVASGLAAPVLVVSKPNDAHLYVVEQRGLIKRVDPSDGSTTTFLDFSSQLVAARQGFDERGLLGFAFHPDYDNNFKVYTYISEPDNDTPDFSSMPMGVDPDHQTVVAEWLVLNPMSVSPQASAERELLRIDQPQFNHNGGMIQFAPDGNLLIAIGDGGNANDQGDGHGSDGNGRDNTNPLGAILRIDVDGNSSSNGEYGIPSDNPFAEIADPGLDEIYAYGFRNPYRFSIHDLGGQNYDVYVGDVGQNQIEEIDLIESSMFGGNYGWNYKEGSYFFYTDPAVCGGSSSCISSDPPQGMALPNLLDPIAEYDHSEGISVIAGPVYQGTEIAELTGQYVFGEWSRSFSNPQGRLFYLNGNGQMREFLYENAPNVYITGMGTDQLGEIYVVGTSSFDPSDTSSGSLLKLSLGQQELCLPIPTANGNLAVICL